MEKEEIMKVEDGKSEAEELIIKLSKPVVFENKTYYEIDLTGLNEISAADMVTVSRRLNRSGNMDVVPEMSLEYALNMAAESAQMPVEFFMKLKPSVAMKVKGCVTNFLYRQE